MFRILFKPWTNSSSRRVIQWRGGFGGNARKPGPGVTLPSTGNPPDGAASAASEGGTPQGRRAWGHHVFDTRPGLSPKK